MLRNGKTGDWIGTFEGHKGAVWGCAIDRQALLCATGAADFSAKVWDAVTGEAKHTYGHAHIVKTVDFSADSARLLTGCNDKTVRLWAVDRPEAAELELRGHTGGLKKVLFGGEHTVISGSDDKTIRYWDSRSGAETACMAADGAITGMELSADGAILTTTHGSKVCFRDAATGAVTRELAMPAPVYTASVHPDGRTFIWGGLDNMLHVADFETGEQHEEYKGHFGPVHCARYSPDGEVYASGSEDGTVRLWQTRVGIEYGLWKFTSMAEAAPEP